MAIFIIVPGAFTTPAMFTEFCNLACSNGIKVETVNLPTVGKRSDVPIPNIASDVQAIRQVVEPLLDGDHEVILVTSSLGGVVGTQCLEYLSSTARASIGKKGGISKIVYVSSLILEPNMCALDFFGADPPPIMQFKHGDEYAVWMDDVDDGTLTFSDLPPEEAVNHKAKMARFHSRANFEDVLTHAGYSHVEVHYVVCEEDKIIPLQAQLAMIETLTTHAAIGVAMHRLPAGHLPFVSCQEDLLQILKDIADFRP